MHFTWKTLSPKALVVHKANNNLVFLTNCFRTINTIIGIVNTWTLFLAPNVWSYTKQTHGLVGSVSTMWHTDSLFITADETKGTFQFAMFCSIYLFHSLTIFSCGKHCFNIFSVKLLMELNESSENTKHTSSTPKRILFCSFRPLRIPIGKFLDSVVRESCWL